MEATPSSRLHRDQTFRANVRALPLPVSAPAADSLLSIPPMKDWLWPWRCTQASPDQAPDLRQSAQVAEFPQRGAIAGEPLSDMLRNAPDARHRLSFPPARAQYRAE